MTFPESTWTVPREDCPHPEWWSAPDDESTEVEVSELVGAFVRATQPEIVVETGSAFGATTVAIGRALERNGHGRAWSLELDPDRAAIARERVAGLPVEVLEEDSRRWIPPGPIDLAWLDSSLEARILELRRFRTLLRPGALVGVHDAGPQHGIRRSFEHVHWIRWIYLRTPRGVLFGEAKP